MRDSPKCASSPKVVTEEKPEYPKPKSPPAAAKKPEGIPKETQNPGVGGVASPPKLGRNPHLPEAGAAPES